MSDKKTESKEKGGKKVTLLCNYGKNKPNNVVSMTPKDAQSLVDTGWAKW